jgi:hypothetical protein
LATSTTRLGLTKPDGTDLVDVAVLNTNFDKTDAAAGAFVCTSTTRPSTPYSGQIIYETDTDQSFVWDSATSTWNVLTPGATVCTSASRPASPVPGQVIYETDTKLTYVYASGTWAPVVNEQAVIPFINRTNFLINGGFDIWQRGTSSTANGVYIADRWIHERYAGTHTVSRSTDVPVTTLQYSLSFASTSGSSPSLFQRIEAANAAQLVGQTVTFSIWAKSTVGTGGLSWTSFFPTTTADTFSAITTDQTGVFNATMTVGTWTRYSATFTVAAGAVRGYGVNVFRSVTTANTTTLYAGAQLEIGTVVTAFRRNAPSIQAELAACQRYYYRAVADSAYGWFGMMSHASTTLGLMVITLPVTMRAAPTLFESSAIGAFQYIGPTGTLSSLSLSTDGNNSRQIAVNVNGGSFTGASAGFLRASNNAAAFIGAGAEL